MISHPIKRHELRTSRQRGLYNIYRNVNPLPLICPLTKRQVRIRRKGGLHNSGNYIIKLFNFLCAQFSFREGGELINGVK